MGHLFVPAALVLWAGVAVVRMWAAPAPVQAVEVQAEQPRQVEPSEKSLSRTKPPQALVHGEG